MILLFSSSLIGMFQDYFMAFGAIPEMKEVLGYFDAGLDMVHQYLATIGKCKGQQD